MRSIAITALVLVALTSCTPTSDAGSTPVVPSSTATPTSEPPTAKPELSELVIGPEGLGPLVIGAAPPSFGPDLDVLVFVDDYCAAAYADGYASEPGLWVENYPEALAGDADRSFGVWVSDGVLEEITVYKPGILTDRGIGVGSTRDEVLAAYPEGFSSNYLPVWTNSVYAVDGKTGHLLIEVATPDVPLADTVISLTVAPVGKPITSTTGTDFALGRCMNG